VVRTTNGNRLDKKAAQHPTHKTTSRPATQGKTTYPSKPLDNPKILNHSSYTRHLKPEEELPSTDSDQQRRNSAQQ
jgi:hypothetical protein